MITGVLRSVSPPVSLQPSSASVAASASASPAPEGSWPEPCGSVVVSGDIVVLGAMSTPDPGLRLKVSRYRPAGTPGACHTYP